MAVSIVEKVLGTTNPYLSDYLDQTLRLTKSITVKCDNEANTYNNLVRYKYGKDVDNLDRRTWRYYKHLSGNYHEVDTPMKVVSRDNKKEFVLTVESLELNIETKRALNEYGSFYDEVVAQYPEQELLLRTMMAHSPRVDINTIIKMEEWTIVSYNESLVEVQESDLMLRLQERIYNFSVKNLITHYSYSESLFMASLMSVLYNYIIVTILALRLDNAKTGRVHSFHMLTYFASHHRLDLNYQYMDNHQRLYLYRNLLYLNTHAGSNEVFDDLVNELFTRKRIVVTNYKYVQSNEFNEDLSIKYNYKADLLNDLNFVHREDLVSPEEMRKNEIIILENNKKEYDFNNTEIDFKMSNSLTSQTNTKDLELGMNDNTNDVKYRLEDILMDYWAATTEMGYNQATTSFIDPVTGTSYELSPKDTFRLFVVALHYGNEVELEVIPDYHVYRVFLEELPDDEDLFKLLVKNIPLVRDEISYIKRRVPRYVSFDTKRGFRNFVESMYRFELGMWIYLTSTGEFHSRYDIAQTFEHMHRPIICRLGGENVDDFLNRIGMSVIKDYTTFQLLDLMSLIINQATDNILELSETNRLTQKAMADIFHKFKSYSTQYLNNFNSSDMTLLGLETPYYSIESSGFNNTSLITLKPELNSVTLRVTDTFKVDPNVIINQGERDRSEYDSYVYRIDPNVDWVRLDRVINHASRITEGFDVVINYEESTPQTEITLEIIQRFL